ncbi:PREDICTED: WD repeat-containing protein 75 [Ceratosolen solmsi marchali]|uniref:WD repeat-containing protein 75 n=1 Tax=Ceratosolen solmsi marchali TaxID=326594 RepID=A0AAJ6YRA9_9HYME|nr:PREDICTED: WD repeat-containing protein 75 [Ceratosolen solmsi marchali]
MQLKSKPKTNNKISSNKVDDLILKRKGGGSIIDHHPLFSNDGETLYVVWKQFIRAYSTQTGDFVKELEPASNKIIGIVLSPDSFDTIIGCTDNAELVYWNCHNSLITIKTKLLIPDNTNIKIKTFHLIHYTTFKGKILCNAVVSSLIKKNEEMILRVELFDLKLGNKNLSKDIENFREDYCIDIIGNYGENLIAIAQNSFLYLMSPMHKLKVIRHKTGRNITCIAGHPEEECVATGDTSGRVLVWRNISQLNPNRATYHWHTLPVAQIVFSKSGGYMYSGGGECVLVKWLLSNPQNKSFLPRLPAPIRYLTIASENIYVAVSTLDNGIIIVNPQRKITAVIQNFTWGVASTPKSLFPAGLIIDPRTNSVVLNSRTGHVQFYNTHTKSLLFNLNVTAQNLLTQERSVIIVNTEVTRIAINSEGTWMATMEERDDNISSTEVRLKFWQFNMEKQNFVLNTSIELPHEFGVSAVKFRPKSSLGDNEQFVITVGKDNKFKLWHFNDSSTNGNIEHWRCYSVGFYRNLPAIDAGFSVDGSLIGVGFGSSLTLWIPETSILKNSLSHSRYLQPITRVEFSKQEYCHLVVTASTEHLAIWDLLSLTVKWSVLLNLTTLAADPLSIYMAAFTTDNTLFIFTPGNSEPEYVRKHVIEKDVSVLGACFIPNIQNNKENTVQWQEKSQFLFLNSEQELLTLESKSESSIALENLSVSQNVNLTSYNRIVASERISNIEKPELFMHDYMRITNKGVVEELLAVPAHTLPPMRMLCIPFIVSLMGKSSKDCTTEKYFR